uniref:RpoC1, OrsajCp016 n=1 Tax=Arundo donax TaxID=35708 RepID=A0A0A9B019_ARUDO
MNFIRELSVGTTTLPIY